MQNFTIQTKRNLALSIFLSSLTVFLLFIWQGNKGFNLGDEGFLWYGAQRVMLGEVPIRDFMAYDPGRYYWSAALMDVLGDNGIMSLRISVAIFQVLGLCTGLFLIARSLKRPNALYVLLSCLILVTWMYPRHKLFDISLSLFIIGALTALIENPTNKRFFITGLCIGLIAIFGRNHGVYAVFGSFGAMAWLNIKKDQNIDFLRNFAWWLLGIIAGFLPLILMAIFIPGFALAFLESIRFLFEIKSTNLTIPIPWPWLTQFDSANWGESLKNSFIGLFFIAIATFGVISVLWIFWLKFKNRALPPVFIAASLMTLPYAQFAYSRADINHLAQGIFPFLMGILILISMQSAKVKWLAVAILLAGGFTVMLPVSPGWQCFKYKQCVAVNISKNELEVDPDTATSIVLLRKLADKYTPHNQNFIAAPHWPGAYALLDRKSPVWEIYALFPRSKQFERAEIDRIKKTNPQFAFILDIPLDGQDALRFRNTHPLINQYIIDNFEPISISANPVYLIYKAKE